MVYQLTIKASAGQLVALFEMEADALESLRISYAQSGGYKLFPPGPAICGKTGHGEEFEIRAIELWKKPIHL